MTRVAAWPVLLMLALVSAPLARADYEAGQRAWDAGHPERALAEWRAAADGGDRRAMLALGRLYVKGLGAPQDYIEAYKWFNLAASRGERAALPERDALAAKMTPQQVATAQERAAAWRPGASRDAPVAAEAPAAAGGPPPRAIREAQLLLAKLGYAPGPVNGIWGQSSTQAFRQFLRDVGRPASDRLTPEALRTMRTIAKRYSRGAAPTRELPRQQPESSASRQSRMRPDTLQRAARSGDANRMKSALAAGLDMDGRDGQGWTALMHAALRGHTRIIEMLMEAGADMTVRGSQGETAVDIARQRYGNVDAARRANAPRAVLALLRGMTLAEQNRLMEPFGPSWIVAENQPCQTYSRVPGAARTVTWSGGCVDGKASGDGRLVRWNAGTLVYEYEGQMRDGRRNGRGTFTYADGNRYEGEFRDGKIHGRGTYAWANGERYKGEWRDEKKHGQGTHTWPNGNRYEGEWQDGKIHGRGAYIWANGDRYEGQFRDGKIDGPVTYTWVNGERYQGGFRMDKKHGWGTHTWPNGNRYEGEWENGKMHGRGTYVYANGERHEGQFRDEKKHGQGIHTWPDGTRYQGEWQDDRMHGYGVLTYANGDRYEGEWLNDRPHGHGTYVVTSGGRYEGQWRNGCFGSREGRRAAVQNIGAACGFE